MIFIIHTGGGYLPSQRYQIWHWHNTIFIKWPTRTTKAAVVATVIGKSIFIPQVGKEEKKEYVDKEKKANGMHTHKCRNEKNKNSSK